MARNPVGLLPVPDPTLLTTALTEREIAHLKELIDEKFTNIDVRFSELDKVRHQTAITNREAIDAALDAQKESTTKTELAFTKQIDQLQVLINTIARANDEKIDDVKTRLDLNEGKSKGFGEGWGIIIGIVGLISGLMVALSHYIK